MSAPDSVPEKTDGESNAGAAASRSEPSPDKALSTQPLETSRQPHSRRRLFLLFALLAAVAAWLAYDSVQPTPGARAPSESIALDAAGGWWNVTGERYLELDWEGRRATLWDYSASETGVESTGAWRTTDNTVLIQVSGAAGELSQEYEVVGNDAELFLAPAPAATARLLDSWIADHGSDDSEEVNPGHSASRQAAWRPHHHPRRQQHTHHSRSRHHAPGFLA